MYRKKEWEKEIFSWWNWQLVWLMPHVSCVHFFRFVSIDLWISSFFCHRANANESVIFVSIKMRHCERNKFSRKIQWARKRIMKKIDSSEWWIKSYSIRMKKHFEMNVILLIKKMFRCRKLNAKGSKMCVCVCDINGKYLWSMKR